MFCFFLFVRLLFCFTFSHLFDPRHGWRCEICFPLLFSTTHTHVNGSLGKSIFSSLIDTSALNPHVVSPCRSVGNGSVSLSRCSCCEVRSSSSWISSSPTPRGANLCPSYSFSSHMDLCLGPLSTDGQGQAEGELSSLSSVNRTESENCSSTHTQSPPPSRLRHHVSFNWLSVFNDAAPIFYMVLVSSK